MTTFWLVFTVSYLSTTFGVYWTAVILEKCMFYEKWWDMLLTSFLWPVVFGVHLYIYLSNRIQRTT